MAGSLFDLFDVRWTHRRRRPPLVDVVGVRKGEKSNGIVDAAIKRIDGGRANGSAASTNLHHAISLTMMGVLQWLVELNDAGKNPQRSKESCRCKETMNGMGE